MFKNRAKDNRNNICGERIAQERKRLNLSQKQLADKMQLLGLDIDKNAIQRIECGKRFVTDIELVLFLQFFKISFETILGEVML